MEISLVNLMKSLLDCRHFTKNEELDTFHSDPAGHCSQFRAKGMP